VPAAPKAFLESAAQGTSHGHGKGLSPRQARPRLNYLVDAHEGTIVLYYSATPMIVIASKCRGIDELGQPCDFWGSKVVAGFQMHDPRRFIKTYDHEGKDLDIDPLPAEPVSSPGSDWDDNNTPAVSAHVNATRVYDFYNGVLLRDGIDDKGMDLVSIVNCTFAYAEDPPEWHNAVWWDNRMWYGQFKDANGDLRSYSQFLDVIAHELTHGVTEHTSDLVYQDQSGALNESFSDIFGVIIHNWYTVGENSDVDDWNWEIGPGLGGGDLPLRDMSDPTRTGDPDHMDDYEYTSDDNGGVHTNSNIHNKAAYNLLTARNDEGERVFTPKEAAELYYLCLCRLSSLATFSDVLAGLEDVAKVYWAGFAEERQEKIAHIRDAYERVGIT
jgi:bacillolysin/neutral peptidase B